MIFIDNLSKSYNGNYLFSNVTIGIKRGMRIGLVGANGAGKTTLLRILIGEEDFDSGIRKTVEWYISNKKWWQDVLDGSYRNFGHDEP